MQTVACTSPTIVGDDKVNCSLPTLNFLLGGEFIVTVATITSGLEYYSVGPVESSVGLLPPKIMKISSSACQRKNPVTNETDGDLILHNCNMNGARNTGEQLTILGENFISSSDSIVQVGTKIAEIDDHNDTHITCELPEGFSQNLSLVVTINGVSTRESARLSYQPCGEGKFPKTADASVFASFPPGFILEEMCIECPKGKYNDNPLRVECIPCSVGKYANKTGQSACLPCEPGKSQNQIGASNCTACQPGYYSQWEVVGTEKIPTALPKCSSCVAGKYADRPGATSCGVCQRGRYADGGNNTNSSSSNGDDENANLAYTSCKDCEDGKTSNERGSGCVDCPDGTYRNETVRRDQNVGDEDFGFCIPCPDGYYPNFETDIKKGVKCTCYEKSSGRSIFHSP
jgi:hypothetical protein